MIKTHLKWSKEDCQEESIKYNYKKDFIKQSYGAYQAAIRSKWIDDICSHMIPIGNEYKRMIYRIVFYDKVCYVGLTSNFERRISEHLNKKGTVYSYIEKTKFQPIIIEKLTDYISVIDAQLQEEYWKCQSEEDGYKCLNTAKTGGVGCFDIKWTKEECEKESIKYNTRSEFMLGNHSAYNSARKNKWLNEICSHMIIMHKKWTKEECRKEALKYKHRGEYAKNDHNSWDIARKNGWLNEICSHMIILHKKWTKDECKKEALKYNSRNDFKKNNVLAYNFSIKNNFINEICSHMILLRKTWTEDECKTEAKKYKNITEFTRENHNVYEFARKRKWIDKNFYKNK